MNAVKTVVRDSGKAMANMMQAAASLSVVATGELVNATELLAGGIKAVPGVITATVLIPKSTAIGYVREDQGVSEANAIKIVEEMFPNSVAEAIHLSAGAAGSLFASMMKDDDVGTKPSVKRTKATK